MKRVQGNSGVALLECVSPIKNKWRIRWDVQTDSDGVTSYMEEEFKHRPSDEEIRAAVIGWHNDQTDEAILSGFSYEDTPVWLSQENQFNYKAAYDLAVQTDGATLPVTFKFGTDDTPVYRAFSTIEDLKDFYTKAMQYIQETLAEGWTKKDAFNVEDYHL